MCLELKHLAALAARAARDEALAAVLDIEMGEGGRSSCHILWLCAGQMLWLFSLSSVFTAAAVVAADW